MTNAPSLTPLIRCSLYLSLLLLSLPTLFSPVVISHKYSGDFIKQYHWIDLTEQTRLFHFGDCLQYNYNFFHGKNTSLLRLSIKHEQSFSAVFSGWIDCLKNQALFFLKNEIQQKTDIVVAKQFDKIRGFIVLLGVPGSGPGQTQNLWKCIHNTLLSRGLYHKTYYSCNLWFL
jgi:hypothetical protein